MKNRKKIVSIFCCLGLVLFGCGAKDTQVIESGENTTMQESVSETQNKLREAGTGTVASKKEEMVYASADPNGNVYETKVETTLTISGDDFVLDRSSLSDIKNTEGGEEFISLENGEYLWENLGENIQYEGVSETPLPVNVTFSFTLDGREIQPEDLIGKSGHIVIRVDYTNMETREITVEDTTIETVVPFTAITAVMLDEDKFTNLEVTNGDVVSVSGVQMAVGYAMPGVKDALDIDGLDLDALDDLMDSEETESEIEEDDFDIPDYVEIEADVVDFSLEFTETIVTPGLLSDMDTDVLEDLESAIDGMTDLGEVSKEIRDGFYDLKDGVDTVYGQFKKFNDGIGDLKDGTTSLKSGMKKILSVGEALETSADGIATSLESLETALADADLGEDFDFSVLQNMQTVLESTVSDMTDLMTVAAQMQTAYTAIEAYESEVNSYQTSVEESAASAQDYLNSIDVSELTEEQQTSIELAKNEMTDILNESKPTMPEYSVDTMLLTSASTDLTGQIEALAAAVDGMSSSLSGLTEFSTQIGDLISGITALSDAAGQLNSGVTSYNDALGKLYKEGIVPLADGAGTLAKAGDTFESGLKELSGAVKEFCDGYVEFDEDGIAKLASIGDSDAKLLLRRIRALKEADVSYDNFSGKYIDQESSVTFLIETDAIE